MSGSTILKTEIEELKAELKAESALYAELKAEREQAAIRDKEIADLNVYVNKLKEADEKKRIAAEKRREANKNKPKKPKAPVAKAADSRHAKGIEELKNC